MIDLKTLDTFVRVARLSSFRAAAERLHTTQPAISQRIAALEAALGVPVLTRTTRRVTLTPAGRTLLDGAERLLALHGEMLASVTDPAQRVGTLRLGVAETIVHTWLPLLLERTTVAFPRLVFDIEVDITANLRQRLLTDELDVGFVVGPLSTPRLTNEALCSYSLAFIASPNLGLPKGKMSIADFGDLPIITFARNTHPHLRLVEVLQKIGLRRTRIHASTSVATIARMALDGLGVALIPPATVRRELEHRQLVILRTLERVPDLSFVAAWSEGADAALAVDVARLARDVSAQWQADDAKSRRRLAKG